MTRLLADIAGPFYDPAVPFRNWSALPFYQLDLAHPPFVDLARLDAGVARAEVYLAQVAAQGYTGVVVDNLAHLVTFDSAPARVYAPDEPARLRALAYGAAFGRLFAGAAALGLEVFVTTDMQWGTPGLRRYVGRLAPDNPRLAAVNRWAVEELFTRFPGVAGLFVRVGEAGGAHDQGAEYTGHMLYRSERDLRGLIDGLLPICERRGRLLVVRTWSVGIGAIGDMLWSPERYGAIFGGYSSPNLLVSVKHTPADFFRLLPPNPTVGLPGPNQIVELQSRREYELFGMAPSGVARLHGRAVATAARPRPLAGVWVWNATGGWGGGTAALGAGGWSIWTELSSALTAALVRDPAADAGAFVRAWCEARFPPGLAAAVTEVYLESEELIERGWYLGSLAGGRAALAGVTLPTLLWVWWMRPTAAPLIWAYLAAAAPDVAERLAASRAAHERLGEHAARLAALAGPGGDGAFVAESVRYLRDCVGVAVALRELLLAAFAAAGAGDRDRWLAAVAQAPRALAQLAAYRSAWGGRADFPALELDEVEAYLWRLARAPGKAWPQARAASLAVRWLMKRGLGGQGLRALGLGALALAGLGAWRSPRARPALAALLAAGVLLGPVGRRAVRAALPWLSRRYNLLPSIFFEAGPSFTEWTT
jgi:hypothetical protein